MNGRLWAASPPGPLSTHMEMGSRVATGVRHTAWVTIALLVLLAHGQARPVAAQEAGRPSRCANWQLTGRWARCDDGSRQKQEPRQYHAPPRATWKFAGRALDANRRPRGDR